MGAEKNSITPLVLIILVPNFSLSGPFLLPWVHSVLHYTPHEFQQLGELPKSDQEVKHGLLFADIISVLSSYASNMPKQMDKILQKKKKKK